VRKDRIFPTGGISWLFQSPHPAPHPTEGAATQCRLLGGSLGMPMFSLSPESSKAGYRSAQSAQLKTKENKITQTKPIQTKTQQSKDGEHIQLSLLLFQT